MSQPLAVIITDTHLSETNTSLIESIFDQSMDIAEELGLDIIYHDGDLFTSRKGQPLSVSKCFIRILRKLEARGFTLRIHPGNHDKADYHSEDSFLDIFERYPSMQLVRDYASFEYDNVVIHMIPFFEEALVFPKYLTKAYKNRSKSKANVLLTHIAVNGVRNNDGSEVENQLTDKAFEWIDLVMIGHYHNYQELDNVVYIGSTHQHNFGEDKFKGITVLYDDLTFEQQPFMDVPVFSTTHIDLNKITDKELKKQLSDIEQSSGFERIKFTGSLEKMVAAKKTLSSLQIKGIKVEKSVDNAEIQVNSQHDLMQFKGFDSQTILDEFEEFAEIKRMSKSQKKRNYDKLKTILIK